MVNTDFFTMWFDDVHWFPFVESETCDITGPGHQDPEAFAKAVTQYDMIAGSLQEGEAYEGYTVDHIWIVLDEDEEQFIPTSKDTEGAVPVTTIWGIR